MNIFINHYSYATANEILHTAKPIYKRDDNVYSANTKSNVKYSGDEPQVAKYSGREAEGIRGNSRERSSLEFTKKTWYTTFRSLFGCFLQSEKPTLYNESYDTMDNSLTQYINNIFTSSEIAKILSSLPEYNTDYIPKTPQIQTRLD